MFTHSPVCSDSTPDLRANHGVERGFQASYILPDSVIMANYRKWEKDVGNILTVQA